MPPDRKEEGRGRVVSAIRPRLRGVPLRVLIASAIPIALVSLSGCGSSDIDPYALTCSEIEASADLREEAADALADDIHNRRPNTPKGLVRSELDIMLYCSQDEPRKTPGSEIYEEEVEWYGPVERLDSPLVE